jgi:hypothetical protein
MKLTKMGRRILMTLNEHPDDFDLVYEEGAGWWLGNERVSGKAVWCLIRDCLISRDNDPDAELERWSINQSGCRALKGFKPYRAGDGKYYSSITELTKSERRNRRAKL